MSEKTEKRHGIAGTVEAVGDTAEKVGKLAESVSKWTPQRTQTVLLIVLVFFLLAGFGALLWAAQERERESKREMREQFAAMMREFNAQVELGRVRCEEKEARLLAVFAAEREKDRQFWASENEKSRREFLAHLKSGGGP